MTGSPTRPALPDHLSINPRSLRCNVAVFEHDVGIRYNGKERKGVNEYCIDEGWIKAPQASRSIAEAIPCSPD